MNRLIPISLLLVLAACGDSADTTTTDTSAESQVAAEPATAEATADASAALNALFDEYYEAYLELNPIAATSVGDDRYNDRIAISISDDYREKARALHQRYFDALADIDVNALGAQDRLSYELFRLDRAQDLESLTYPSHLQPINQFYSFTSSFARLGSGTGLHPFKTVKDYEDFLSRIDDFVSYVDVAIANMREGAQAGVVQPRVLMDKVIPQLDAQLADSAEESGFFGPVMNMPAEFSDDDRERLTAAYVDAIENKILPSYERLLNFVSDEYLTASRETVGMAGLPGGEDWYAFRVRRYTTTEMTPDEIHTIGLNEVKRIQNEMRGVMAEVGFEGTLEDFFEYVYDDPQFFYDEPEQLIQGYRDMADDIAERAKLLFDVEPKTPFEVRAVEPFRERSASKGSYVSGTPDGKRPGIFYANTYDVGSRPKWDMTSLFLHEAIPGHHFQRALQREAEYLPNFRRFGGYTAYTEGWGLYSETLGKEMGLYDDRPYDYFGALNAELWRSIRLVVDTGLHAKGWSRQDVLDFMFANSAVSETRAVAEAERFMAIPGQALAYKIGQLKILDIRRQAEERLGDRFDVIAFHREILKDGPLPLSVLEAKIMRWADEQV